MKVNDAKKALLYGKALRFVRMAAQTLDTRVPSPLCPNDSATEAIAYTEAMEALDKAAARLSMLKGLAEARGEEQ